MFIRAMWDCKKNCNFYSKIKKFAKIIFKIFFNFFFPKINRISTEFFFKYEKKMPKLFSKFFPNFFFETFFFTKILFYNFFWWKFFYRIFFGEHFSVHKNISAKIVFTIFSRISFVFDVCEIMYFAKFFIRNFRYCEFFCFAISVYGKKIVNFVFAIFFSAMNVNAKFENVSFLERSKIFSDRTFGYSE